MTMVAPRAGRLAGVVAAAVLTAVGAGTAGGTTATAAATAVATEAATDAAAVATTAATVATAGTTAAAGATDTAGTVGRAGAAATEGAAGTAGGAGAAQTAGRNDVRRGTGKTPAVVTSAAGGPVDAGGGASGGTGGGAGGAGGPGGASYSELHTAARFSPPMAFVPSLALTYDTSLVPAGARIEVEQRSDGGQGTTVLLRVSGVRAGHAFGTRVHTKACGADPAAAGGPYRHLIDPLRSPADPTYVDAQNEVWLDFTADAQGAGAAQAHHTWGFRSGQAGSVVILDRPGAGGVPVACFTVPFGAVSEG